MPRKKITFSDNQIQAIDNARGNTGFSEYVRQILSEQIEGFEADEIQHGGERYTKHGYEMESETHSVPNTRALTTLTRDMQNAGWRPSTKPIIDQQTGEITVTFERIIN